MNIIELSATLAATSAAYVAYLAFRSATDPEVIVYPDLDLDSRSIIFLVIKNIGHGPAYNISFKSSHKIPHHAFGIKSLDRELKYQTFGPLLEGLPFLAPQQEIKIMWGQFGGLIEATQNKTITVTSTYHRKPPRFPLKKTMLTSYSELFVRQFEGAHVGGDGYKKEISDNIKKISQHHNEIKGALRKINDKIGRNTS